MDWAIIINFSHKISPYKINDKLYEAIKGISYFLKKKKPLPQ